MTDDDGHVSIELEQATMMKLRRQKAALDDMQADCPDHTTDGYVNYLLDTERAVREGYYDAPTAAELLAARTGRPVEAFKADGYEYPDPDDLTWREVDDDD